MRQLGLQCGRGAAALRLGSGRNGGGSSRRAGAAAAAAAAVAPAPAPAPAWQQRSSSSSTSTTTTTTSTSQPSTTSNRRMPAAAAAAGGRQRVVRVAAAKGFGVLKKVTGAGSKQDLWGGREPITPHKLSPPREVPASVPRPPYAASGRLPPIDRTPQLHTSDAALARMRAACRLAAEVLAKAGRMVAPGVTTDAIDAYVHELIVAAGAYPSPLNYGGFPKSVCTSVNEVMCHGIPDGRPLRDGDIVNIDVTVFLAGYHGDTSRTFYVGAPPPPASPVRRLVEANEEALRAAIAVCGPGVPFTAVGAACADVAAKHKLTVVRDFIGHGVGTVFHAAPHVFHHRNSEREGSMQPGQTFTIEPIFVQGSNRVLTWKDDWTATTADGGLAAQCEHTVLITPSGAEVLTRVD